MTDFYFTFGHGHIGFPGYVIIRAPDVLKAREVMVGKYGTTWCHIQTRLTDVHELDRVFRDELVWQG